MPDDAFIKELLDRYHGDRDPVALSGVPASPAVSPELLAALHGPSDPIMQQARGMQAGLTRADPVELAMGLMGPRAGAIPRRMVKPTEWPVKAAVKIGDQIFSGPSHVQAIESAAKALGDDALNAALNKFGGDDGFLTNTGRYVNRKDAATLVDQRPGGVPLYSEALTRKNRPELFRATEAQKK